MMNENDDDYQFDQQQLFSKQKCNPLINQLLEKQIYQSKHNDIEFFLECNRVKSKNLSIRTCSSQNNNYSQLWTQVPFDGQADEVKSSFDQTCRKPQLLLNSNIHPSQCSASSFSSFQNLELYEKNQLNRRILNKMASERKKRQIQRKQIQILYKIQRIEESSKIRKMNERYYKNAALKKMSQMFYKNNPKIDHLPYCLRNKCIKKNIVQYEMQLQLNLSQDVKMKQEYIDL